jgi:hypothetical protein
MVKVMHKYWQEHPKTCILAQPPQDALTKPSTTGGTSNVPPPGSLQCVRVKATLDARAVTHEGVLHTEMMLVLLETDGNVSEASKVFWHTNSSLEEEAQTSDGADMETD